MATDGRTTRTRGAGTGVAALALGLVTAAGIAVAAGGCASTTAATAAASASASDRAGSEPPRPSTAAGSYLSIADDGNKRLDHDFDRLAGVDRGNLAAARADLSDIAVTEHAFDERLAALALPPDAAATARGLITANEARAALTRQAAGSGTEAVLAGYQGRLTAANAPVEQAVRTLRDELRLPAPDTD